MNQNIVIGQDASDSIEAWVCSFTCRLLDTRDVERGDIKKLIDEEAVPLIIKINNEVDALDFRWCRAETESDAEINDRNNSPPKIEQSGNRRSS